MNKYKAPIIVIVAVILSFSVFALTAGKNLYAQQTLQKKIDLGSQYLSQMEYEQAIACFTDVLAADPQNLDALLNTSKAYAGMAEISKEEFEEKIKIYENAIAFARDSCAYYPENMLVQEALLNAYEAAGDFCFASQRFDEAIKYYENAVNLDYLTDKKEKANQIREKIISAQNKKRDLEEKQKKQGLQDEINTIVSKLEIPFSVDEIVLGKSPISAAINRYLGRPYAHSNRMNEGEAEELDAVYNCYGMDMPVPDGREEREFGFFFAQLTGNNVITEIQILESDFECLGGIHIYDDMGKALDLFGVKEVFESMPDKETLFGNEGSKKLELSKIDGKNGTIQLVQDGFELWVDILNGRVNSVWMGEA